MKLIVGKAIPAEAMVRYGLIGMVLIIAFMISGIELFSPQSDLDGIPTHFLSGPNQWVTLTYVVNDIMLGVAYLIISLSLGYLARKMRDSLPFVWIFTLFGVLFITCGITFFIRPISLYISLDYTSLAITLLSTISAAAAAIVLILLTPKIIASIHLAQEAESLRLELARKETMLEYEQNLHAILDHLPISVFQFKWGEKKDTFQFANQTYTSYLGADPSDNDIHYTLIHPDHIAFLIDLRHQAEITGRGYEVEVLIRRHDGVYRWHLLQVVIDSPSASEQVWYDVFTDIDDQKRAHERKQKEIRRLRKAFMHDLQHEIKTPTTAISMSSQILRRKSYRDENVESQYVHSSLDVVDRHVARLTEISDRLNGEYDYSNLYRELSDSTAPELPLLPRAIVE